MNATLRLKENTPALVAGLLMVDSLHFVFARLLLPHLPPVTSAMFVLAVATVEIAIYAKVRGGWVRLSAFRHNARFFLAIGLLIATSTYLNYAAVAFIDPGTASLLAKASVLFGLGFGIFWLGDHLTTRQNVGTVVSIIGVAIITFQPGDYLRIGALMVLASTLMYALHTALVKQHGNQLAFTDFFFFRLLTTTGFLFSFATASGHLTWPSGTAWLLLILVGTVDVVISRGLYYLSLRQLSMSMHTLVLTVSPVVAIAWSMFLFDTFPMPQQIIGGVAVLLGVLLVTGTGKK